MSVAVTDLDLTSKSARVILGRVQDAEEIRRWVSEAEAEVAQLAEEADGAARRLSNARRRLALLHEVLATVSQDPTAATPFGALSTRNRVIRDARTILADFNHPMPISAIHTEFVRRGFALPGRGSPTNLVAHLGATNQIKRLARGVYGLPDWEAGANEQADHNTEEHRSK